MPSSTVPRSYRRWPQATLRTYLVAIILFATVPLAFLTSLRIVAEGRLQREVLMTNLRSTARAIALVADRELTASRDALAGLGQADTLQLGDTVAFERRLRAPGALRSSWSRLAVLGDDGKLLFEVAASNATGAGAARSAAADGVMLARAWSAQPHGGVLVSELDLAGAQRGTWVGMPAVTADGRRYLLAARVGLDVWQSLLEGAAPEGGGFVSLFDRQRRVLARTVAPEKFAGQALPASAVAGLGDETGGIQRAPSLDGGEAYVAWQMLRSDDWGVAVGVPAAAFDAAQKGAVLWTFGVASACLLLGVTLALLVARRVTGPLERLLDRGVDRGHALGDRRGNDSGDPHGSDGSHGSGGAGRTGIAEITRLHDAFDRTERDREELMARESTARRDAEAASRAKDELLSMLGHELRNPLNAIVTSVEVLRAAPPGGGVADSARGVLTRQTRKLARLVDELLDVGHVMADEVALTRRPLELRALLSASIGAAQPLADARQQRLRLDAAAPVWIDADLQRMGQVMAHLLENAIKHTPPGGPVAVVLTRQGADASVCVEDSGPGIDAALLPRIFEPFVQGERGLDRSTGGLGIGLALVKRLVALHGGSVQARSSPQGSVFEWRLPAIAAPGAPAEAAACRIGVIEDNPDALASVRSMLELAGHPVSTAADGLTGVAMLLAERPRVALVDIGLPGIDGYEVARRCRAAGYTGRLIAVSGYGQAHDLERSVEYGFDAYLVKPLDPERLLPLLCRG